MMRNRPRQSLSRRDSGLALIEAVAGMALLGGLLVAILMADSRLSVQARRAGDMTQACRIADELLARWHTQKKLPRNESGAVEGHAGWTWRTQTIDRTDLDELRAQVLRVELFPPAGRAEPAVGVELLVEKPGQKKEDREGSAESSVHVD